MTKIESRIRNKSASPQIRESKTQVYLGFLCFFVLGYLVLSIIHFSSGGYESWMQLNRNTGETVKAISFFAILFGLAMAFEPKVRSAFEIICSTRPHLRHNDKAKFAMVAISLVLYVAVATVIFSGINASFGIDLVGNLDH